MDNLEKLVIVCSGLIIGCAGLVSSLKIIPTSHIGIETLFGRVNKEYLKEGVYLRNPLSVIDEISLKQKQESFDLEHTQTLDMQPVAVKYKVVYSINEEMALRNTIELRGDVFQIIIAPRANSVLMDVLARYGAEEIIVKREEITKSVLVKLSEKIKDHANIIDITIADVHFENEEFASAVQNKVIAKQKAQEAEIRKRQSQAEADSEIIKAKASAEASMLLVKALKNKGTDVIRLKELENERAQIEKWDGRLPSTYITNAKEAPVMLKLSKV